ncbi:MAG: ABC transporter substrate-binding protein [Chromatiales bacterium]|nr:ABC transporter substrate-binding protein [Chromatiales bacterium]
MSQITIMSLRHSAFYSPLLMTMAGGFLQGEGLEPSYRQESPGDIVVDNIRNGSCDLAQSSVATSFAALQRGELPDIVHFAQINARDGFFIAAREPDESFTWEKLAGRNVLVDHFFQPMAMFRYALHRKGVAYDSLKVVDAGQPGEMLQAFLGGRGDYIHLQGPAPQQLEQDGHAFVVAAVGDAVGPVAFSSLCASRDWLRGEKAKAFMRAYRKSQRYVLEAEAEEIAARQQEYGFFTEIDPRVLANTIRAYQQLGCWQQTPDIPQADYENLLDVFAFCSGEERRYPFNAAIVAPPG